MFLYVKTEDGPVIFRLVSPECWFLASGMDKFGNAQIFLHILNDDYPLCCSLDLCATYPGLTGYEVQEYYDAIVAEVFKEIRQGHQDTINLAGIQEKLLDSYLAKWKAEGYLSADL